MVPSNNGDLDLSENAPNMSLMLMAFSTTFGNMAFQITTPQPGDIDDSYPTIPYLSQEAIFYQQMSSNPLSAPQTILGGTNTGQQVIGGQITQVDQNNEARYMQGYQSSNTQ